MKDREAGRDRELKNHHLPPLSAPLWQCFVKQRQKKKKAATSHPNDLYTKQHNSFTKNHVAAANSGPARERDMWKMSVVKARRGPQPFSSPTIFGDDVIIHKKNRKRKMCLCLRLY